MTLVLKPLLQTKDREAFAAAAAAADRESKIDDRIPATRDPHRVAGHCLVCDRASNFEVDFRAGGSPAAGPNWREDLICERCHLSNRQRLLARLAKEEADRLEAPSIYLMEETTPLYRFFRRDFGDVHGSEFFSAECEPGQRIFPWHFMPTLNPEQRLHSVYHAFKLCLKMLLQRGLHHEDIARLSFAEDSFDLVISGDVFEHVPMPAKAFSECARVLKPGGVLLATFPIDCSMDESITRARLVEDGELIMMQAPVYHGNPVSDAGSLVFTDFGWDVLKMIELAGFCKAEIALYRAPTFGHPGPGVAVIRAEAPALCQPPAC